MATASVTSAPLGERAPHCRPAIERCAIDAAPDAPVPWLLALIPVGSLVMAGLLLLLLARFAMPVVSPSFESSLDEASLGMPTAYEVEGDVRVLRITPVYTR